MTESVSKLYLACRNGDLASVEALLPTLSLDEINRIEPNGSTCLHAASYFNHPQIVKLLLDRGATRTAVNTYNCTPLGEAATDQIVKMFSRSAVATRMRFTTDLPSNTGEWVSDYEASRCSSINRMLLDSLGKKFRIADVANAILSDAHFQRTDGMDQIKWFLQQARLTDDPIWLIKAYTAETGFYSAINTAIGQGPSNFRGASNELEENGFYRFVGFVGGNEKLEKYSYIGRSYRGMKLSKEDFKKYYAVDKTILIKPFTSTSKRQDIGERFATAPSITDRSLSVLCTFIITGEKSLEHGYGSPNKFPVALDVSTFSEYPDEEEVLILPHNSFQIQSIQHLASGIIEIQLLCIDTDEDWTP